MTKRIPLLLACFAVFLSSNYTTAAQQVVSFMGGSLAGSSVLLSFSAGEPVSGILSNSSISLVGGFPNGADVVFTSSEVEQDLPQRFSLSQNYPNPFNPSTTISYDVPKSAHIRLEVFNSIGALVAVLVDEQKPAGSYTHQFNASQLASGMYFYRLRASGGTISTKKMILIK